MKDEWWLEEEKETRLVTEQRGKCEGGKKPPSRSIDTYF